MSLYKLENVSKTYYPGRSNACRALDNISLEIRSGELISIIGESGSGKSTLLHILGFLDSPTEGAVYFRQRKISASQTARIRNTEIGFVLQDFGLILNETVLENVMVPLLFRRELRFGARKQALEALRSLGIENLANKRAGQLSGGQKQRTAIARALVNSPEIILADEPTGALDSRTSSEIVRILLELNERGKTVVIVTHDKSIARLCGRTIEISDGRIIR